MLRPGKFSILISFQLGSFIKILGLKIGISMSLSNLFLSTKIVVKFRDLSVSNSANFIPSSASISSRISVNPGGPITSRIFMDFSTLAFSSGNIFLKPLPITCSGRTSLFEP